MGYTCNFDIHHRIGCEAAYCSQLSPPPADGNDDHAMQRNCRQNLGDDDGEIAEVGAHNSILLLDRREHLVRHMNYNCFGRKVRVLCGAVDDYD